MPYADKETSLHPPAEYVTMPHWMWIWKVGSRMFCDAPSCSQHVWGRHILDGRTVAELCREHFPAGVPVINHSISWCADCDQPANRMDFDGKWRCPLHQRDQD